MRYLRGVVERVDAMGEDGSPIRFVASTDGLARDGLIIPMDAWDLENYRKNPVVLWSHDYSGARPPIGRAQSVYVEEGRLMAEIVFDQTDEFARSIESKYRNGFLHTVSVGWDTQAMEPGRAPGVRGEVTRADLLDISAVPVPGDPNALISRQARALAQLAAAVEEGGIMESDPDVVGWSDTAAAMVSLYCDTTKRSGEEWSADYKRLSKAYARLGKTPPEPLDPSTLDLMGLEVVRGLFLENEAEMFPVVFDSEVRAGAVLSRENVADLRMAVEAIGRVMGRAIKVDPEMVEEGRAVEADPEVENEDALSIIYRSLGGQK
jgi:hypothetical protein